MDVKMLYPSLRKDVCKKAIIWIIDVNQISLDNVDWVQMTRYIAVNMTPEEIANEGLSDVIPGRVRQSRVKLTMNALKVKTADKDWLPAPPPNDEQKLKIFGLVMAIGIDTIMSNHTFMMGDDVFLQTNGGPIGLEAAGAIARVVMIWWDSLYLAKVRAEGYILVIYERYVDDSNQGLVVEEDEDVKEKVMKLKEIADSILPGIEMEVDIPENHEDGKLPILDMKVYMSEGYVVYEHYSKPMATNLVISARSAHSDQTKRSVHISECVRRMCNTSPRLSWDEAVVPHVSEYSRRMMAAGYSQTYRKEIIRNSVKIYDSKIRDDAEGIKPLNRPRGFQKKERHQEKRRRKMTWGTRGGYTAPVIVPATPGGELARRLREVAEAEAIPGLKFKISERGGMTVERQLQKSNPTASSECGRVGCGPCGQPGGNGGSKLCQKNNVVYEYECEYPDCDAAYRGETSKNLFTRNLQHQYNYNGGEKNSSKIKEKSFIFNHQQEKHNGEPANFKQSVLRSYKDCLSRQAAESVFISKMQGEILNSKSEFHQPPIVTVRREINRGL